MPQPESDKQLRTLDYVSPSSYKHERWPLKAYIAMTTLALFVLGIVVAMAGAETYGMYVLVLSLCLMTVALVTAMVLDFRKARSRKDADYDGWEDFERRKAETIAVAKRVYVNGPVGRWRFARVQYQVRGAPILLEERIVEFELDGKGRYHWSKGGISPVTVETLFEYTIDPDRGLIVRTTNPPKMDWTPVKFDFESHRDSDGEPDLFLWFEGENPLPPDIKEYWPFWGELQRSAPDDAPAAIM